MRLLAALTAVCGRLAIIALGDRPPEVRQAGLTSLSRHGIMAALLIY